MDCVHINKHAEQGRIGHWHVLCVFRDACEQKCLLIMYVQAQIFLLCRKKGHSD